MIQQGIKGRYDIFFIWKLAVLLRYVKAAMNAGLHDELSCSLRLSNAMWLTSKCRQQPHIPLEHIVDRYIRMMSHTLRRSTAVNCQHEIQPVGHSWAHCPGTKGPKTDRWRALAAASQGDQ